MDGDAAAVSGTFEAMGSPDAAASAEHTPDLLAKTRHPKSILRKGSSALLDQRKSKSGTFRYRGMCSSDGMRQGLQKSSTLTTPRSSPEGSVAGQPSGMPSSDAVFVPIQPAQLFPAKPPTLVPADAHLMINQLEERVRLCEEMVGSSNPDVDLRDKKSLSSHVAGDHANSSRVSLGDHANSSRVSLGDHANSSRVSLGRPSVDVNASYDDAAEGEEGRSGCIQTEWRRTTDRTLLARTTLSNKLRHLQRLSDIVYSSKFSEFEKKYHALESWIEAEHASVSQIILSTQAKRFFVLEHDSLLRSAAQQLKTFHELKPFVNPPSFGDLSAYQRRLTLLEASGYQLGEKVHSLNEDLQALALAYSTAMTVVNSTLRECSDKVAALSEQRKGTSSRLQKRKTVAFAD